MHDFDYILKRIEEKKEDYKEYNFTKYENDALKTFFDLAQEFDEIEDFYNLCVAIPKGFFNFEASLYVIDAEKECLTLIAKTKGCNRELNQPLPDYIKPADEPYYSRNQSLILTIRGKASLMEQLPFRVDNDVIGILEIFSETEMDDHGKLFFQKYANRIGFNMHNRFLAEKNIEHLRFIKSLVADIEHNIIVPNMVYKLFLRGLRKRIEKNLELEREFAEKFSAGLCDQVCMDNFLKQFSDINQGLLSELENIEKHYKNMSLFIETLFRKSHFDEGKLTLRTKPCNMKRDVLQPQLERYLDRFRSLGIEIDDQFSGIPEDEVITVVDIGLIAQVYANFFSNALKYTEEITTEDGQKKKYISYGYEILKDYFGPGKDGVKFNVFSTGPNIPESEQDKLFEEEFRGTNSTNKPGTGHGLAFVKNAIEIHGGVVGYEPTKYGNNFYFILPK